jgi:hypothetical protein
MSGNQLAGLDDMSRISMGAADDSMNKDMVAPQKPIQEEDKTQVASNEWK